MHQVSRRHFLAGAGTASLAAFCPSMSLAARAEVADFYRGKTLRIIVGYGAGGGFDVYARVIGRHLGDHIPGRPVVIVENMPGAGGLVAANALYNTQPEDGTVVSHLLGELALLQVLGYPPAKFDAHRFNYIGAPTPDTPVLIVRSDTNLTSVAQLRNIAKPLICAGQAPGTNTDDPLNVIREAAALSLRIVDGYQGTHAMQLAVEQGEAQGTCLGWESMKVTWAHELQSKQFVPIGCASKDNDPELKDAPTFMSLAPDDDARQMIRFGIVAPSRFQRVFMAPPGVPPDRVDALRQAFLSTMKDPAFLVDAKTAKLSVAPIDGATIQRLVSDVFAMPPAVKVRLARAILPKQ